MFCRAEVNPTLRLVIHVHMCISDPLNLQNSRRIDHLSARPLWYKVVFSGYNWS